MSDTDVQAPTAQTNGAAPHTTKTKRRIANASIEGSVVNVQFSAALGGLRLSLDTAKTPDAERAMLAAQGAASVIQGAYSTADDPVEAAKDAIGKIQRGEWRPGPARGEALPDPMLMALAEHLTKESGKEVSIDHVENKFLPAYQAKHGYASIAAARRKLAQHPEVSKRRAEIEASRAKKTADKVKGMASESLSDLL